MSFISSSKRYEIFCITVLDDGVLFFNGINKNYEIPHEFSFKLSYEGYEGLLMACDRNSDFRIYSIEELNVEENICMSFMVFSKLWQGGETYPLYIS